MWTEMLKKRCNFYYLIDAYNLKIDLYVIFYEEFENKVRLSL